MNDNGSGKQKSKKEQIIAKATTLFFANGILATSMDEIAAKVPVSKMTIYKYFNSKERLLGEVLERYMREQHNMFKRYASDYSDPLEAITAMMSYKQENIPERFLKELLGNYPQYTEWLMNYYRQHIAAEFEKLILDGQQMGRIRAEISPRILMLYIQAVKEFLAKPEVLREISDFHVIGQQFRTIFLYGIAAPTNHGE